MTLLLNESASASSPDSHGSLFHHKSWTEPWTSAEFPPEEPCQARRQRFQQKPWWRTQNPSLAQQFLRRYAFRDRSWPWGWFIYRTTYASEEDWTAGLAKLDRHFESCLPGPGTDAGRLVREGFRNVIVDDKSTLDGVSAETVIQRHREWAGERGRIGYGGIRYECCLMIDEQCLQSILRSGEPVCGGGSCDDVLGYINILDLEHDKTAEGYDEGPFYDGCMRLDLDHLWIWPLNSDDRYLCEIYVYINDSDSVCYIDSWGPVEVGLKSWVTYTREMDASSFGSIRTPLIISESMQVKY